MVIWITGLSGAGKTTIARGVYDLIRKTRNNVLRLDGDVLRHILGATAYSAVDRQQLAIQYSRLCQEFSNQGLIVICATMSMFDVVRNWNRANIEDYFEVYVKVSMDTLISRDQKGIYSGASAGTHANVVGLDIPLEEPKSPDFIAANDAGMDVEKVIDDVFRAICRYEEAKG